MAAKRPTLGVDHPTVVPANFADGGVDGGEREGDESTCPACGRAESEQ